MAVWYALIFYYVAANTEKFTWKNSTNKMVYYILKDTNLNLPPKLELMQKRLTQLNIDSYETAYYFICSGAVFGKFSNYIIFFL